MLSPAARQLIGFIAIEMADELLRAEDPSTALPPAAGETPREVDSIPQRGVETKAAQ